MDKNQCSVLWHKTLEIIKNQVSPANFRTWFANTACLEIGEGKIIIAVPHAYVKNQLATKLKDTLADAISQIFGQTLEVEIRIDQSLNYKRVEEDGANFEMVSQPIFKSPSLGLNSKYTMENFVVGLSNNLAYAAAQQVIQNPGLSYNPLFIYGGTGVGKTHLMQAIGNALVFKNKQTKIIYCSSEKFMNDFIESIQSKKTNEFRNKYRLADLLLIDDIQFISGRDSTQEEFFHTFNELQTKNSQVVLTSDRPPNDIQKLEPRLASRFQGGLMVDIQLPDFDTRVAILRAKCQEKGDILEENILTLIAENMNTNARELEGKLVQFLQMVKLNNLPLNEETVRSFLGKPSLLPKQLDYKKVILGINQYFSIKMADITGPRRKKELVLPRQIVMYLLYQECKLPYARIGELLGGRDHTTIMHGVEKVGEAISRDREVQRILLEIKQALQN